ncbi:MAG: response regulator transcription factor [Lachnospiraceae bacterium]|nr:response regulator transcription factor [Lachnospiraceae bacterium]
MAYRVVIADDEKTSRSLFEYIINDAEDYNLEGSFPRAGEAADYCTAHPVDLCIMDIVMREGESGLDAAARIRRTSPDTRIVLVTSNVDPNSIRVARKIGVHSFWYKETSEEPLLNLIGRTMAGESIYPDNTPKIIIGNAPSTEFTNREYDVLRELVTGKSNRQIADTLAVSEETVKSHIQHMLDKTGYGNRVELSINAALYGLVTPGGSGSDRPV